MQTTNLQGVKVQLTGLVHTRPDQGHDQQPVDH